MEKDINEPIKSMLDRAYNQALDDFAQGLKDYVYEEKTKGKEPYWTVAIDNVKNNLKN